MLSIGWTNMSSSLCPSDVIYLCKNWGFRLLMLALWFLIFFLKVWLVSFEVLQVQSPEPITLYVFPVTLLLNVVSDLKIGHVRLLLAPRRLCRRLEVCLLLLMLAPKRLSKKTQVGHAPAPYNDPRSQQHQRPNSISKINVTARIASTLGTTLTSCRG